MSDRAAQWVSRADLETFLRQQDKTLRAQDVKLQGLLESSAVDDDTKVTLRESQVSCYGGISALRAVALWAGGDGVWSDGDAVARASGWVE